MFIKICGLTSLEAVEAAAEAGVDAVGFVFAPSPRRIAARRARALARMLPEGVLRVAVTHHPTPALVAEVLRDLEPDWLQSDAEDFETIALPQGCAPLPVYRSGRPPAGHRAPRRLLFEGPASGSGRTADWQEARRLARETELILAGGLDAGNVAAAIREVRPWGVDVSSGVERAPGEKDPARIAAFVAHARAAALDASSSPQRRRGAT